jgi:hypothetical protein
MLQCRVPVWVAIVPTLCSLTIPVVRAQQPADDKKPAAPQVALSEYPYLPDRYGEPYIPSIADWQAIRLTALGASTTRITDQFYRQQLSCFTTPKGLALTLDLVPVAGWKHVGADGKLTGTPEQVKPDLQKAVDVTMRFVRNFFAEVRNQDVALRVYVNSQNVGSWEQGKLTLNSEAAAK